MATRLKIMLGVGAALIAAGGIALAAFVTPLSSYPRWTFAAACALRSGTLTDVDDPVECRIRSRTANRVCTEDAQCDAGCGAAWNDLPSAAPQERRCFPYKTGFRVFRSGQTDWRW